MLERQQSFLFIQAAAVACQAAVGTYDTVAGDDDADGVAVVGAADRYCWWPLVALPWSTA